LTGEERERHRGGEGACQSYPLKLERGKGGVDYLTEVVRRGFYYILKMGGLNKGRGVKGPSKDWERQSSSKTSSPRKETRIVEEILKISSRYLKRWRERERSSLKATNWLLRESQTTAGRDPARRGRAT